LLYYFFFFSSRRRHTRSLRDWSSDVCSSDLGCLCRTKELVALAALDPKIVFFSPGFASGPTPQARPTLLFGKGSRDGDGRRRLRSEERRVGKECRSLWWAGQRSKEQ